MSRYWFNRAVEYLKSNPLSTYGSAVLKSIESGESNKWAFECPQRIRLWAVTDAVKAVRIAKSRCAATGKYQEVKFRSRKNPKQGFSFDKVSLHESRIFARNFSVEFRASELVPEASAEGTRLVMESGRYYLIVPVRVPVRQSREPRQPYAALDPGIRTFLSYYSEETHGFIGKGDFSRIARLCFHLDGLISRAAKQKAKPRRRIRKAAERLRWKIKDLISDLHWKAARFLVTRFDAVLLPSFNTSEMARKAKRRIRSKTVRMMMTYSFFRFRQRLESEAEKHGAKVIIVDEAYTSKTCSYCGTIHEVGSRKTFRCRKCQIDLDRDLNGARGIYLRALSASTSD